MQSAMQMSVARFTSRTPAFEPQQTQSAQQTLVEFCLAFAAAPMRGPSPTAQDDGEKQATTKAETHRCGRDTSSYTRTSALRPLGDKAASRLIILSKA
jgi:hypothetical protein